MYFVLVSLYTVPVSMYRNNDTTVVYTRVSILVRVHFAKQYFVLAGLMVEEKHRYESKLSSSEVFFC